MRKDASAYAVRLSISSSQRAALASLGMRQSPRGLTLTEPTLGSRRNEVRKDASAYAVRLSISSSQRAALASLGMRQSPRGLTLTEPTLGPSGRQLRLNC